MAAFMGKDVTKLKAKGGGKVSNFPSPCVPDLPYDLSRKISCWSTLITATVLR